MIFVCYFQKLHMSAADREDTPVAAVMEVHNHCNNRQFRDFVEESSNIVFHVLDNYEWRVGL